MSLRKEDVVSLYVTIFGRAPEKAGVEYWMNNASSIVDAAKKMLNTPDAKAYLGDNISDEEFINNLYINVLGKSKDEDPEGVANWVKNIEALKAKGYSELDAKAEVVGNILKAITDYVDTADENTKKVVDKFLNKLAIADKLADTIPTVPNDPEVYKKMLGFKSPANPDGVFEVSESIDPAQVQNVVKNVVQNLKKHNIEIKEEDLPSFNIEELKPKLVESLKTIPIKDEKDKMKDKMEDEKDKMKDKMEDEKDKIGNGDISHHKINMPENCKFSDLESCSYDELMQIVNQNPDLADIVHDHNITDKKTIVDIIIDMSDREKFDMDVKKGNNPHNPEAGDYKNEPHNPEAGDYKNQPHNPEVGDYKNQPHSNELHNLGNNKNTPLKPDADFNIVDVTKEGNTLKVGEIGKFFNVIKGDEIQNITSEEVMNLLKEHNIHISPITKDPVAVIVEDANHHAYMSLVYDQMSKDGSLKPDGIADNASLPVSIASEMENYLKEEGYLA